MTMLAMVDKSQLWDCLLEPNCSVNTFVGPLIALFFYHCGMWVWGLFDGFEKENEEETETKSLKWLCYPLFTILMIIAVTVVLLLNMEEGDSETVAFMWICIDLILVAVIWPLSSYFPDINK